MRSPILPLESLTAGENTYAARSLSDVEQRWFPGAHADVGGGYENGLLAQRPLLWIMQKAAVHGLVLNEIPEVDEYPGVAPIHDSFAQMAYGVYRACKFWRPFYREVGGGPQASGPHTTTTINETIDDSVFARWSADASYRPSNLAWWANEKGVDMRTIRYAVRADDPSIEATWPQLGTATN